MIIISAHWARNDGKSKWKICKRMEEWKYPERLYRGGAVETAHRIANDYLALDWCDAVRIFKDGKLISEIKKEA